MGSLDDVIGRLEDLQVSLTDNQRAYIELQEIIKLLRQIEEDKHRLKGNAIQYVPGY